MWISRTGIVASSGGILYDVDALAFITAATITDSTQQSAVIQLVTDLKTANIWTKMKAIYPFVGGTASSHRFNLKAPTTNASDFYLDFVGGGTHSATGYKPNGTTAYANTFFNPFLNLSSATSSNHISVYIRENIDEVKVDMGALIGGTYLDIESRISNASYYGNLIANNAISFSNTDSRGLHINTRTTSSLQKVFINNILKASSTNAVTGNVNASISLASRYNSTLNAYEYKSSKEQAFATIGDGLSDSEVTALYNAVQTFNTTLGRQV